MRNALATVGHMAFAIAIAAVVSVISLIAIARVQWPAYPSSNQLHALTTVGQVGCIVGLLAALVAGLAAIHVMLRYVRTRSYAIFVVERLVVAALVLVVFLSR